MKMGERLDSLEKSTAQEKDSQELYEKTFSNLSQSLEGLANIPEGTLENFLYTRDNLEDITYIFKFIANEEMYLKIVTEENSSFDKFEEKEQTEIRELASLFHSFLVEVPFFCENKLIDYGEEGSFIAFVNKKERKLCVSWKKSEDQKKNIKSEIHNFHELLKKTETTSEDYPEFLRSSGDLKIYLDNENFINIEFSGDASKKDFCYAPGYLRKFEEELREFFQKKFEKKLSFISSFSIKLCFNFF
jgi:hypothetical protein